MKAGVTLVEVCPFLPGGGEIGECAIGAIAVMREAFTKSQNHTI